MSTVTLSSRFRIVVPRLVCERLQLKPGQQLQVLSLDGRIELIPLRPMQSLRGAFPGLDLNVDRDSDQR